MSKRISGAPRRPRNPVAKAVRTPQYRQRVERDRKQQPVSPSRRLVAEALAADQLAEAEVAANETDCAD